MIISGSLALAILFEMNIINMSNNFFITILYKYYDPSLYMKEKLI
jgi:hypothetical protein